MFLLFVALCHLAVAQGTISGKVTDARNGQPIEYATVTVLHTADSTLAGGALSDASGSFAVQVPQGSYVLRVSFMGYATYQHPKPVTIGSSRSSLNLGTLPLEQKATMLRSAVVTAQRSMVEYHLDKRVVNVDKNIVSGGGTATDILENVPSVAIDNDGNVTLRGSTNVKVLIDGRPYELLGSELETILEQIPASSVENIEVITNPSAKYDPEGMSGIINIKLKERTQGATGLTGMASLNGGSPLPMLIPDYMPQFIPTTMASLNLNYNTEHLNLFLNADGGLRSRANTSESRVCRRSVPSGRGPAGAILSDDSLSSGSVNTNYMASVKLGGEYIINKHNSLLASYQLRLGNRHREGIAYSSDLLTNNLLDYTQADTSDNRRTNHAFNLLYTHKFDRKDQLLTLDISHSRRRSLGDGLQEQTYHGDANYQHYYLRTSESERHHPTTNIKINYTHPFDTNLRLETGYEGQLVSTNQNYTYYYTTYDSAHTLQRVLDQASSTHFVSEQQIHAIYLTLGGQLLPSLSAQAGLRAEYSHIGGRDLNHPLAQAVDKNYYQLYPTLHLSYQVNSKQSLQLSYSRRVRRPHMWDINPYIDVRQGMEMSFGNPGLAPEFTNAYELSYNIGLAKTNIFLSAYYRQTDSMMTRYGFVWDAATAAYYSPWMNYNPEYDGYWASTWQNLNKGRNYGLEAIVDQQLTPNWRINISVNLYQSMIEGTALLGGGDTSAFRASGKFSSYLTLPHDWTIQLSGQYRAPFFDLQTNMFASYWADLAVKKDFWERRATFTLRVGDLFATGGFGHLTDSPQLYREFHMRRLSPTVTLGLSCKIAPKGKYKPADNQRQRKPDSPYNDNDDDNGSDAEY